MTDQKANTALKQYLITITSQAMELRETPSELLALPINS